MTPLLLVVVPLVFAVACTLDVKARTALWLLMAAGLLEAIAAVAIGADLLPEIGALRYVRVDATTRLFVMLIDAIFFGVAVYVWNRVRSTRELEAGIQRFVGLALLFLAAANCVLIANHLVAMWIALEATTLAAAPLIVRSGIPSSRLASWRYLLFSAVGLGLAFLGLLCLSRSMEIDADVPSFFLDTIPVLTHKANEWRLLGLALAILGFGTKLGLAPMYTWLPDVYDEAPPATTALLAAVQFNCALVALVRVIEAFRPGCEDLVAGELLTIGLASMAVSTVSIIATRNFKRLLAYASINHAGVIAIGLGVGKSAAYGVVLYVVSNAFIKAILFLTAGKIKAHYRTKDTREIAGLLKDLPYSGLALMVGTFALLGFPPFGSFLGELIILSGLVQSGQILVFTTFCLLIAATFVATGRTIFPMIWGEPKRHVTWPRQTALSVAPKVVFFVVLVAMGLYVPPAVGALFREVSMSLGER